MAYSVDGGMVFFSFFLLCYQVKTVERRPLLDGKHRMCACSEIMRQRLGKVFENGLDCITLHIRFFCFKVHLTATIK